jgi:hypothetical protein
MSKSGGHGGHSQSHNDQRANSLNPNNSSHRAANDNRSNQLNPNNALHSSTQQNNSK